MSTSKTLKYLSATAAYQLDQQLENKYKIPIPQAMDKAGYSCAVTMSKLIDRKNSKIVVFCGPGNNGGDGIVAANFLKSEFGFDHVTICYPKFSKVDFILKKLKKAQDSGVEVVQNLPDEKSYDSAMDAIFGFSFNGTNGIRPPFDKILSQFKKDSKSGKTILSIDVPSGWDVDSDTWLGHEFEWQPSALLSLTAPKYCSRKLNKNCRHFLAGKEFLPDDLVKEFQVFENFDFYDKDEIVCELDS